MKILPPYACHFVALLLASVLLAAEPAKNLMGDAEVERMAGERLGHTMTKTGTMRRMATDNSLIKDKVITGTMQEVFASLGIPVSVPVEEIGVNGFYVARFRISPGYELIVQGNGKDSKYLDFTFKEVFLAPHRHEQFRVKFSDPRRWHEISYP